MISSPGFASFWSPGNWAGDKAKDVADSMFQGVAADVAEAVGTVLTSLATMWVHVGAPVVTKEVLNEAAEPVAAPETGGINTVLGYVMWIGFGVAVMSLMALAARFAWNRSHDSSEFVGKIGLILGAVVLMSSSASIVSLLFRYRQNYASDTVGFLQDQLWWYMLATAMFSVIVASIQMLWQQRAEPGKDLLKGLLTLVVVAAAATTVVGLLTSTADSFSVWILHNSLGCTDDAAAGCTNEKLGKILILESLITGGPGGASLAIVLGVFALVISFIQMFLMVIRSGMIIILLGVLPLTAASSATPTGQQWFKRSVSWLIAFILYKPAAAIVYATAFKLTSISFFNPTQDGPTSVITGLALMGLAVVALPALMKFVTPLVAATAGGGGAGLAEAARHLPTGSGRGRLGRGPRGGGSGGGGGGGGGGNKGPEGAVTTGGARSGAGASGAAGGGAAGGGASAAGAAAGAAAVGVAAGVKAASIASSTGRSAADHTTGQG